MHPLGLGLGPRALLLQIASRMFGFHMGEELPYVYLVPALDMLNNAEEPNSQRDGEHLWFHLQKLWINCNYSVFLGAVEVLCSLT